MIRDCVFDTKLCSARSIIMDFARDDKDTRDVKYVEKTLRKKTIVGTAY